MGWFDWLTTNDPEVLELNDPFDESGIRAEQESLGQDIVAGAIQEQLGRDIVAGTQQELLGQEILDASLGAYQESLGRGIVDSLVAQGEQYPWWNAAAASMGDLAHAASNVAGAVIGATERPQQIFNPQVPGGSTQPNTQYQVYPTRNDWQGRQPALFDTYNSGVLSGDIGKALLVAAAALLVVYGIRKAA